MSWYNTMPFTKPVVTMGLVEYEIATDSSEMKRERKARHKSLNTRAKARQQRKKRSR